MRHINTMNENTYKQRQNGETATAMATTEEVSSPLPRPNQDDPRSNTPPEVNGGVDSKRKGSDAEGGGSAEGVGEGVGASILDIAFAVMAAAEEVAHQLFMPGVREAATMVAGLARLAADRRSNAGSMERRVRWCRSIVLTLERAGEVLGKVRRCYCCCCAVPIDIAL